MSVAPSHCVVVKDTYNTTSSGKQAMDLRYGGRYTNHVTVYTAATAGTIEVYATPVGASVEGSTSGKKLQTVLDLSDATKQSFEFRGLWEKLEFLPVGVAAATEYRIHYVGAI